MRWTKKSGWCLRGEGDADEVIQPKKINLNSRAAKCAPQRGGSLEKKKRTKKASEGGPQ